MIMEGSGRTAPSRRPLAPSQLLSWAHKALTIINKLIIACASLALIAASVILSYSVMVRALLRAPTYWQDEASVFLLVGATFMTAAYVQSERGHVAIEAVTSLLSARMNHFRTMIVDLATLAFCLFFSWKSWTLWHEAVVDGQISSSTWGPPLWIPYSLMAVGMSLLCLQLIVQIALALEETPS
jgi:TRAP-type C4-dicarboxylate transport system permease small subunit